MDTPLKVAVRATLGYLDWKVKGGMKADFRRKFG